MDTAPAERVDTERVARSVVTEFFDRLQDHDVEGMGLLCSLDATFRYVPIEFRSKQRVLRAQGTAHGIGKAIWLGMISSFPDLSHNVTAMSASDHGDVVVQVDVSGTQELPWAYVKPRGRRFTEPHLFILHVGDDELIDDITAYWNDASIVQQLGHLEVD